MTRLVRLWKLLVGHEPDSAPEARRKALEAYEAARARGDTRGMRETWLALKAATCTELRG